MIHLKFHPRHIQDVKDGSKRLTARLDFNKDVGSGDTIKFVDASNSEIFGKGVVTGIYDMDIEGFIETDWEYHRNYSSYTEFEFAFKEYYPEQVVENADTITIIEWNETFRKNRVYEFA